MFCAKALCREVSSVACRVDLPQIARLLYVAMKKEIGGGEQLVSLARFEILLSIQARRRTKIFWALTMSISRHKLLNFRIHPN